MRAVHPLLAAVAKRQASGGAQRDLHQRVADSSSTSRAGPCTSRSPPWCRTKNSRPVPVGGRAGRGARRHQARGRPGRARLRLTPADRSDADRLLALGRYLHHAGEKQRLTDLLSRRLQSLPEGAPRVKAYLLLINGQVRGNEEILTLLEQALAEAGDDPVLRGRVLSPRRERGGHRGAQIARADARAAEALASASRARRRPAARPLRAQLDAGVPRPPFAGWSRTTTRSDELIYLGRPRPRRRPTPGLARPAGRGPGAARAAPGPAEERAELYPAALARLHLCELELRAGRWGDAEPILDEWAESTDTFVLHWPMFERCQALLAAGRGRPDARRWARRAVELADTSSQGWDLLEASRALGAGRAAREGARRGRTAPGWRLGAHPARGGARPGGLSCRAGPRRGSGRVGLPRRARAVVQC